MKASIHLLLNLFYNTILFTIKDKFLKISDYTSSTDMSNVVTN